MDPQKQMELARIIGEPVDPLKPFTDLISAVCNVDTADPDEYVYYFDALDETRIVYVMTNNTVTQTSVSADSPVQLTFNTLTSPQYYVPFLELLSAKENTLARKRLTIEKAMDAYENYKILQIAETAVAAGRTFDLDSGTTRFTFKNLVDMIDSVTDYGDSYVLVVGTQIDKEIKLWDWNDNKYTSLASALKDLNVRIIRQFGTVTIGSDTRAILEPTKAFLFAVQGPTQKPLLWVRKNLNDLKDFGGQFYSDGNKKPQRLIIANPAVMAVGSTPTMAHGLFGVEQFALAVQNLNCIAYFNK